MKEVLRIFFVTDIHGSNVCWRKFLNALSIYKVDVGIALGDLTGKMLIPLIKVGPEQWETNFLGSDQKINGEDELTKLKKTIEMVGYYWVELSPEEFANYKKDQAAQDNLFRQLMLQRLKEWISLADERLKDAPYQVFMSAGNDDLLEVESVISQSKTIINCGDRVVNMENYEMATFSWTNPTPWQTPREKEDEELEPMLEDLLSSVHDFKRAIFNFHAPPYGSSLDLAPQLSKDLVQAVEKKVHVGSKAVLKMIQKYQPMLGLHGHIHESRGMQRIGHTLLLNPGSEYSEGILRGAVIRLQGGRIKDCVFTSG